MNNRIEELLDIANKCETAAQKFEEKGFDKQLANFEDVIRKVHRASSNSWIGYHANVYYAQFETPRAGDHFSAEWGFQSEFMHPVSANWVEYTPETVRQFIYDQVGTSEKLEITDFATSTSQLFIQMQDQLVNLLNILLEETKSEVIEGYRDEAKELKSFLPAKKLREAMHPRGQFMSRDSLAMSQGFMVPPHIDVKCRLYSLKSHFIKIGELAKISERTATYIRQKYRENIPEKNLEGMIFIGHGRSLMWRDLSTFLKDRLKLDWDEFNREPTAGISIKERLETMLDHASFAFIIMTAEDEHSDNSMHARENVIHEVGLFQGRLTFKRAIILLEDGCQEFSNIHGIGQIRFPKGNIRSTFEDIRLVLEREGLVEDK